MAFAQLEGAKGRVEIIFFSKAWAASQRVIATGMPVLLTGILENGEDGQKVKTKSVELLSEVRGRLSREAVIRVSVSDLDVQRVQKLKKLVTSHSGNCPVRMYVELPKSMTVELLLPKTGVDPASSIRVAVNQLFGSDSLEYR